LLKRAFIFLFPTVFWILLRASAVLLGGRYLPAFLALDIIILWPLKIGREGAVRFCDIFLPYSSIRAFAFAVAEQFCRRAVFIFALGVAAAAVYLAFSVSKSAVFFSASVILSAVLIFLLAVLYIRLNFKKIQKN
jgi:hypothetical protein